ncbi:UNVERIFIED_CONTAM: hypothetical protein FKN15_077930 [Acipenser sinensis]
MLFWHKHNIEKSLADLPNFTPFPDEWTVEDKVLFEQGFSFHGKTFHRIQQMLPDKSIASLVKFYYSWKKTRTKTSVMDRHARKQKRDREESEEEMEENVNNSSDAVIDANKENKTESGTGQEKQETKPVVINKLPDKSIASLVKFYYSWKKTRTKTSVMDRHARKQKRDREERCSPPLDCKGLKYSFIAKPFAASRLVAM